MTFVDYSNDLVTHRIIDINEDEVITKGDANNVQDKPLEPERIKGKVIRIVPKVGNIVEYIKNPFVVITIVIVFIMLIRAGHNKEIEKKDERLDELRAEIEKLKSEMEIEKQQENAENVPENSDDSDRKEEIEKYGKDNSKESTEA